MSSRAATFTLGFLVGAAFMSLHPAFDDRPDVKPTLPEAAAGFQAAAAAAAASDDDGGGGDDDEDSTSAVIPTPVPAPGPCSVAWRGGTVRCTRAERDAEWAELKAQFAAMSSCGSGWRSRESIEAMEPLFTGEEWPSIDEKKSTLFRARKHYLLQELSAAEKAAVRRFVFVDLGSRAFKSSTADFLEHYPDSHRFEVHAFDMDAAYVESWQRKAAKSKLPAASFHAIHAGVSDRDGTATVLTGGKKAMKNLRGTAYTGEDKARQASESVPIVNLSRWLWQTVAPDDFVVVKMDIEGSEYEVLPSLLRSRALLLVDELMLEIHYNRNSWESADRTAFCSKRKTASMERAERGGAREACIHRNEAVRWIQFLRDKLCIHAHEWR